MNQDALKKIYRCLALAKSSNSHEAGNAMRHAQALMTKYGITEAELLACEVSRSIVTTDTRKAPPSWVQGLKTAVAQAFECSSFWITWSKGTRNCEISFVGVSPQPDIAAYAFSVLYRLLKKQRADYIQAKLYRFKRINKTAMADAFCTGWVQQVAVQCRALNPSEAKASKVAAYLAIHHPKINIQKTVLRFDASKARVNMAVVDGQVQGKTVSVHTPMASSPAKPSIAGGA